MKKFVIIILSLCIVSFFTEAMAEGDKKKKSKIVLNDNYQKISLNNIKMWFANNGDGSHDPTTDGCGFYWPGGDNAVKTAVFEDGLIFGGIFQGEIRVNGNTYRKGLQAGKILPDGTPDDPTLNKYRVYKILKNWENLPPGPLRDQYRLDYNEWPILDGAPYEDINGNGVPDPGIDLPLFVGDETAWYVANDMDSLRSQFTYGTLPMGLEFQTTIFAFSDPELNDMIFKKYIIINKGNTTITDMYLAYWSDSDLGDFQDDFSGCDTILNLGYTWNADNEDGDGSGYTYGLNPPAIGYDLLQCPIVPGSITDSARFKNEWRQGYKNLPMTAFPVFIYDPSLPWREPVQGIPQGSIEFYNYLQGFLWDGSPFINPHTGEQTKFVLTGDPVGQTGWYEGAGWPDGPFPGDRRHVMSSGPFFFSPGDTQEVIIGIVIARGTDNLNSISELKIKDHVLQNFFDNFYTLTSVDEPEQNLNFELQQNYPNPFNPETTIGYSLPEHSKVVIKIFNTLGEEIETLINQEKPAGNYRLNWYAGNLPSGVYLYRIQAGNLFITKKMMLVK